MKKYLIAGPCQHESFEHSLMIAQHCKPVAEKYGFEYIFKASFDKANRSSDGTKRGVGFDIWFDDFKQLKSLGYQTLTDIHEVQQAEQVKDVVDVIQIPAFLCRQTDLVKAACATGKIVNIKKGQFLAPWDVKGILTKTKGAKEVWVTERGTSFGYNTLVNDFTGIKFMLDNYPECNIVMDATHSVQKPGGNGTTSGGNREYVPAVARAAAAVGVTSFFMEVHDNPECAPSDGPNALRLDDFESVVQSVAKIMEVVK